MSSKKDILNNRRLLVIAKFHSDSVKIFKDIINYYPNLDADNLNEWEQTIQQLKPQAIIFGTNTINSKMLNIWREAVPNQKLFLIRRGVTLARCDVTTASKLEIQVFNTPGVNAPYISKFICDLLFNKNNSKKVAILGLGQIGALVAKQAAEMQCFLNLYSKKLFNSSTRELVLHDLNLNNYDHIVCHQSIKSAFKSSDGMVVALPFANETIGLITANDIQEIPSHSTFISISFPKVLTDEAMRELYNRTDINVIFDHLKHEIMDTKKILGIDKLRPNFILDEQAATAYACQRAMDNAAMELYFKLVTV